jgi:hypothetical protein
MTAMTIDTIKQTDLTVSERQVLDDDRDRWRRMGSGAHLDDWLAYGPGLLIRRRLAMRIAYVNRPEGKGYARAFAKLMEHDGLDTMDKTSISAVLWLHDAPERLSVLREIRETMTVGQRARLNSPISARQRVEGAKSPCWWQRGDLAHFARDRPEVAPCRADAPDRAPRRAAGGGGEWLAV